MLFQELLYVLTFAFKLAVWGLIAFTAIPLGILVLFLNIFPDFTHEGSLWFWAVFVLSNLVAYFFLWKPVLWMITTITTLFEEVQVTKQL